MLRLPWKKISWSILLKHETLFTAREAAQVILQRHQMLRPPRNIALSINPLDAWNAIYNARTAQYTFQLHQILHLPRKMNLMIDPADIWNMIYNARNNRTHPLNSPNTAPATQNDCHDWSRSLWNIIYNALQQASPSHLTKYCTCHVKWVSWLILLTYETSFTIRGRTGLTLPTHQLLRLPRKMTVMIDRAHIWNVIYNARSNRHHPPTSPNIAPATQNCTPKIQEKFVENGWSVISQCATDPRMIRAWSRAWSDHENANRNPPRHRGYFSRWLEADSIENYNMSRSG